ncbi:ABC transporter substrate-binding protein [Oerskovia jenensis]|uniref:NitT/TauT family transport system substrate-binding protein n=1 Tax=Oerskovia jenensis TaxID=162169 RepID=A0ABS2LL04_9CELL|nr:ABC transporter substrate-binding protein [Oerskovia jenensis]MBM7480554.1 NitT/TauT family transport system substrate-binding protein [Oerskovia jenensis]
MTDRTSPDQPGTPDDAPTPSAPAPRTPAPDPATGERQDDRTAQAPPSGVDDLRHETPGDRRATPAAVGGPVAPGADDTDLPAGQPHPGPPAEPYDPSLLHDDDATDGPLISRRHLLVGGVAVGALLLGGAGGYLLGASRSAAVSPAGAVAGGASPSLGPTLLTTKVLRIVEGGGICEAPLYAAHHLGIFKDYGLNVEVVRSAAGEDTKDGISSGTYAGGPGIFFSWLKPIEQGLDVKLTTGLHEGCLRLVVLNDSPYDDVALLRGKKIGVSSIGNSAMSFFSLDLLDAGINPDPAAGEVEWVVYDNDILPQALQDGEIQAIAASDPVALLPTLGGYAHELANNQQGLNAQTYCCATAINGALVRDEPEVAKALTEAWAEGARYVGANIDEIAQLEVDKQLVAADVETVRSVLTTYGFSPSAVGLRQEIEPGIAKFAKTGYLDQGTDPKKLADLVYADLGLTW